MNHAPIACCAVVLIAQIVASTAHTAATQIDNTMHSCSIGPDAALETLGKAKGMISTTAIHEENGEIPRTLAAFRCVVRSPDAVEQLVRLLETGPLPAQLYALIGLKTLSPQVFARKIPAYLARKDRVALLGGDVAIKQTVGAVSADIADGRYSVLMPASMIEGHEPKGGFTRQ